MIKEIRKNEKFLLGLSEESSEESSEGSSEESSEESSEKSSEESSEEASEESSESRKKAARFLELPATGVNYDYNVLYPAKKRRLGLYGSRK